MAQKKSTRYILQMTNRPGELMRLTRFFAEEGVNIDGIAVASIGGVASIQFSTSTDGDLPKRLKRSGLEARVDS